MCWKQYPKVRTYNKKKMIYEDVQTQRNWAKCLGIIIVIIIIMVVVLVVI